MKVQIQTKLRKGIKDIEGEAILNSVGKDLKITHISVGEIYYLEIENDADVDEIAKKLFVNELLYDYEVKYVD